MARQLILLQHRRTCRRLFLRAIMLVAVTSAIRITRPIIIPSASSYSVSDAEYEARYIRALDSTKHTTESAL